MIVDFGPTTTDYSNHRAGFPAGIYSALESRGCRLAGAALLDLGSGTGTLTRGCAERGAQAVGLDIAPAMLRQARALAAEAGLAAAFCVARAECLPFGAAAFDLVTAGQCWHWFDRLRAAAEVRRVLRPGGTLVICHFDWIPLPGNLVAATEALIEAHNPEWRMGGGSGLYPAWLADAAGAGFRDLETFSHDLEVPYSHAGWRGRIRASAGVGGSLPAAAVARFDEALAALLAKDFPAEPLAVPHRLWALLARAP